MTCVVFFLGNPGSEYASTRHNAAIMFSSYLCHRLDCQWKIFREEQIKCASVFLKNKEVVFARSLFYMNDAGKSLRYFLQAASFDTTSLIVAHDDADLALGAVKVSFNRGSGGHRGVESVIDTLGGRNFYRLRIGIGRSEKKSLKEYVLEKFDEEEKKILYHHSFPRAQELFEELVEQRSLPK